MKEFLSKLNFEKLKALPLKRICLVACPCVLIVALALVFSLTGKKNPPVTDPSPEETVPVVIPLDTVDPTPSPSAQPVDAEETEEDFDVVPLIDAPEAEEEEPKTEE